MPLSETRWKQASSQRVSPTDLYEVLENHAPKALTLDEIRGRGSPQPRKSNLEDTLQRLRIQTPLDMMIYKGDTEKEIADGDTYYQPTMWINRNLVGFSAETTEEAD